MIALEGADPQETGTWVIISCPKCVVVLTRAEFIAALKRGKGWRRQQAWQQREGGHDGPPHRRTR